MTRTFEPLDKVLSTTCDWKTKMAVPGMGYFAVCHDMENNSFGIWESNDSAK
jgi:hypothetical protein